MWWSAAPAPAVAAAAAPKGKDPQRSDREAETEEDAVGQVNPLTRSSIDVQNVVWIVILGLVDRALLK